jgi:Lar family restriction alleviation protein
MTPSPDTPRQAGELLAELLACPFCGADSVPAMAMNMQGTRYYRQCNSCNMQGPDGNTREERDAAWNRRAATSAPRPSGAVPQDGSAVEVAERITEIRRHHEVASTPEARGMSAAEWARQHATLAHWERGDLLEIAAALLARIHQLNDAFEWHDIPVPGKVEP